ncbi:undecaprenyl-diphosphate phosphatase [uncultured Muribaculum sp.]|uniref:undecaprenyl-diphosphate phosphatase n=1 Tax=uncultured Muribaculum sp. TaxID=1918613 RepID=UPI002593BF9D|nr:undecaprenyl-diphosphate phosphatase [uncultured Muribaculum sp.]
MDWLDALILGIVQGLSEYLPISSSGHLEIFREILGINLKGDDILEFDIMLHAATVLSTIVVLWKEFYPLCKSFFTVKLDNNFYYVCKILLSCVPVAIVGFCFKDFVESFFGGDLMTVGICLCITAVLLSFAYFTRTRPLIRHDSYQPRDITWLDAFIIGCSQAIAVLPGLSRSGTTIATGILLGDKRDKVASFSFFMVIIPILGESLLSLKDILAAPAASAASSIGAMPLLIGFIASFLVGCLACKWMIELVKKGKLVWFAVYCLIMGIICICW